MPQSCRAGLRRAKVASYDRGEGVDVARDVILQEMRDGCAVVTLALMAVAGRMKAQDILEIPRANPLLHALAIEKLHQRDQTRLRNLLRHRLAFNRLDLVECLVLLSRR